MMSLWDALRMNMMISYQELVRTFPNTTVQSASAVQGVVLLFTLVPSVFYVLTAVSIKFYGLTENRMNGIVDDLKHGTFAES